MEGELTLFNSVLRGESKYPQNYTLSKPYRLRDTDGDFDPFTPADKTGLFKRDRKAFRTALKEIADQNGGILPNAEELKQQGRNDLAKAIHYYGGISKVRKNFDLGGRRNSHPR